MGRDRLWSWLAKKSTLHRQWVKEVIRVWILTWFHAEFWQGRETETERSRERVARWPVHWRHCSLYRLLNISQVATFQQLRTQEDLIPSLMLHGSIPTSSDSSIKKNCRHSTHSFIQSHFSEQSLLRSLVKIWSRSVIDRSFHSH